MIVGLAPYRRDRTRGSPRERVGSSSSIDMDLAGEAPVPIPLDHLDEVSTRNHLVMIGALWPDCRSLSCHSDAGPWIERFGEISKHPKTSVSPAPTFRCQERQGVVGVTGGEGNTHCGITFADSPCLPRVCLKPRDGDHPEHADLGGGQKAPPIRVKFLGLLTERTLHDVVVQVGHPGADFRTRLSGNRDQTAIDFQ